MKIVIATPEIHFHSPIVLRDLFERWKDDGDRQFSVVATPKISKNKKSSASIGKILKDTGFNYLARMAFHKLKYDRACKRERKRHIAREERSYLGVQEVCALYQVPFRVFERINSLECRKHLKSEKPDFLVSMFFNQILKKKALRIPSKACINLHPSWLPEYKGMSPILWMLAEDAKEGGATIHVMNEKVDEGALIGRKRFPITPQDTFFSLYRKASSAGADLLNDFLEKGEVDEGNLIETDPHSKYYAPMPKKVFAEVARKRAISRI